MNIFISEEQNKNFRDTIIEWRNKNFSDFPWRKTNNKWHALAAEIMLQRTRAEQVLPVYLSFSKKYKTPIDYLNDEKSDIFKSLGLTWREKEFKKLAKILSENEISKDKNTLLELPGIGDYIASAYRSLHLGIRDIIIDSNVVRLYGRFFGIKTDGETRRKKWIIELADKLTPINNFKEYNYGIIDFTRKICKPIPLCQVCSLNKKCHHYLKPGK